MISALEALDRLRQGNRRFVTGDGTGEIEADHARRKALVEGQNPFAIVLGCSDSRVPAELVFDQGLGDLFVIRVAGNIVMPSQIGSVEFAAEKYGTKLVVVLGHSQCGAVRATLEELKHHSASRSPNLRRIVDAIRPSVEGLYHAHRGEDLESLVEAAVRENIHASVNHLRKGSEIIEKLIQEEWLHVVGAEYSLETGVVEFLEDQHA
jgi:carbonic anhydrase